MSALAELEAQMTHRRVTPTGTLVAPANAPRNTWLEARTRGITATDVVKILGLVTWGNAIDVWLDKVRPERTTWDRRPSEAAQWGQLLEEPIARKWAADRGARVRRVGLIAHHTHPRWLATCDRLVIGEAAALEVKTRSAFQSDEWDHGVPDRVLAQAQWQMLVTGLPLVYVAALVGGQTLASFEIPADPDLQGFLAAEADRVWAAVEALTPPEVAPDHLTAASLNRLHPDREGEIELPPSAAELLATYRAAAADEKESSKAKDRAKLQLLALAGPAETALLDGRPAFTYREASKLHAPAEDVRRLIADHPDLAAQYGLTETTTRTFRLTTSTSRKAQR